MPPDLTSALRPLHAASGDLALLRSGTIEPDAARAALLRCTGAVESSLRRLLRDEERAPLATRLSALAPDELPAPEVVASLRQQGRLSIEFAAALHELWGMRRRLESGLVPTPQDSQLLLRVADRFEEEAAGSPNAPPASPTWTDRTVLQSAAPTETAEIASPEPARGSLLDRIPRWVPAAGAALLLAILAIWLFLGRGPSDLEAGVEHFRNGQVAQAAAYFQRAARDNPEDPTPRLYLARIFRRANRFREAGQELREAIRLAPEDPAVQRELGFLLLDTGRPAPAAERFTRAVKLDPDAADGWVGLVRALRASGRAAQADQVVARAPAEVRALLATQAPAPAPAPAFP